MERISVKVQPRSSQNRIELQPDGGVKAWLTASPTDGQANASLCELIGKKLGIAKSNISVERGTTSRMKILLIEGLLRETIIERLK